MALKGGMTKPATAVREAASDDGRAKFIAGAPRKEALPWKAAHVRPDLMVQLNVKIPEDLSLQLEWLTGADRKGKKRELVEQLLREGVAARLKDLGVSD